MRGKGVPKLTISDSRINGLVINEWILEEGQFICIVQLVIHGIHRFPTELGQTT